MAITLENVFYTYDLGSKHSKEALKDINLSFEDHGFVALIGKTGSGKSTLIQQLNGLLIPTSGKIQVDDFLLDMSLVYKTKKGVSVVDMRAMKKKHRKKIKDVKSLRKKVGLVFQFPEYQLFETTVLEDVAYGPRNFKVSKEESEKLAKDALSLVNIDSSYYSRSPFELSGGEKRRVAIAGILAMKPEVLVLDEPTVGLDCQGREKLMNLLESIHSKGTSIILSTHDMDVVLKYCEKAVVLDEGKILAVSTPLEIFQNPDFLAKTALEPPKVFSFALQLRERGMDLDLSKIKDVSSLAEEILRKRRNMR